MKNAFRTHQKCTQSNTHCTHTYTHAHTAHTLTSCLYNPDALPVADHDGLSPQDVASPRARRSILTSVSDWFSFSTHERAHAPRPPRRHAAVGGVFGENHVRTFDGSSYSFPGKSRSLRRTMSTSCVPSRAWFPIPCLRKTIFFCADAFIAPISLLFSPEEVMHNSAERTLEMRKHFQRIWQQQATSSGIRIVVSLRLLLTHEADSL